MTKRFVIIALNLAILACILLVCIAPLFSVLIAGEVANVRGCQLDEGSVHPCIIGGVDYGETLYSMGVMGWFMLVTPAVAAGLLAVYLLVVGVIWLVRYLRRKPAGVVPPAE